MSELELGRKLFADEEGGQNWSARQSYSDEEGVSGEGERENGKERQESEKNIKIFCKKNLICLKVRVIGTK